MNKKIALIATLPKSGTWYAHNFFWCYEQLLRHKDAALKRTFTPDLLAALEGHAIPHMMSHKTTLDLEKLFICHTICPGFGELKDSRLSLWEALYFPLPYNWGEAYIRERNCWAGLNPAVNPDARVVYLYRNPLDHFVSYYAHTHKHKNAEHRSKTLADGTRVPVEGLDDFVFEAGMLGAFIKHYYPFRQMQRRYPAQVLLMPYESLTANPSSAFANLLAFLGSAPQSDDENFLFGEALRLSSKESLIGIESKLNRSMVGDQTGNEKHIRDGKTGKWQSHFSREKLERIESALNAFDMSLSEFTLTDAAQPEPHLAWLHGIDQVTRQAHQLAFMKQQLEWSGLQIASLQQKAQRKPARIWQKNARAACSRLLTGIGLKRLPPHAT